MKRNSNGAIKIILCIVAILVCIVIFIIVSTKNASTIEPNVYAPTEAPSPTPYPASRDEFILNLQRLSDKFELSQPVLRDNRYEYTMLFCQSPESGAIFLYGGGAGYITGCELERFYLYKELIDGLHEPVAEKLKEVYARRNREDTEIIDAFVRASVNALDCYSTVNQVNIDLAVSQVLDAYRDMSSLSRRFGNLQIDVYTAVDDIRITFRLVISIRQG